MIERFLLLADEITIILIENKAAPPMLTAVELYALREFVNILIPFEAATKIVCGEKYVTASKIIPVVEIIRNKLCTFDPKSEFGKELKQNVLTNFNDRFSEIQRNTKLVIATLLDPRYKKLYIKDSECLEIAINSIKSEIFLEDYQDNDKENVPTNTACDVEEDFWSYHDELLASNVNTDVNGSLELDLYFNEPPISKDKCAIKYWTQRPETPLTKLALKYLCLIATSVPSERLFSKLGQIYTNKRCRLKASNANDLLFLDSADDEYWGF